MRISESVAKALALLFRESGLSANDMHGWLSSAVSAIAQNQWCYVVNYIGDSNSGFVIYACADSLKKAPYAIKSSGGKVEAVVDSANAVDVGVQTSYPEKGVGVSVAEAGARNSKSDLAKIQAMHDHAVSLGATCGAKEAAVGVEPVLAPVGNVDCACSCESCKEGKCAECMMEAKCSMCPKESAAPQDAPLKLIESAAEWIEKLDLREAEAVRRTRYPIRIINPGTGSTAHYPADVLRREAAKFKPGTLMFWNHPTQQEERERPEGNLDNLAAITTSQARWEDNGPKGPGIYAEAKVMADYAEKVEERAPHIGLSIRAGGTRDGDKTVDGKPVLKQFDYIESVDYVTKAGRGGLALVEAARDAGLLPEETTNNQESSEMDNTELEQLRTEVQTLKESLAAATKNAEAESRKHNQRLALQEAGATVDEYFNTVRVSKDVKQRVTRRILEGSIPFTESGELDKARVKQFAEAETLDELKYLEGITGKSFVVGMGSAAAAAPTQEQVRESEQRKAADFERTAYAFGFGGEKHKVGRAILREGRRAFEPTYNAREAGEKVTSGGGTFGMEG